MFSLSDCGKRKQRGDILLESLIGILLMSIIGLGISFTSSRAVVAQRDMKLQGIAVAQMRNLLALHGNTLCTTNAALAVITLPTQTTTIPLVVACTAATAVTIGGRSITGGATLGKVVLTTRSADNSLFGGVIRVGDET
ncbi:type IV pilus modification PilV family protein [Pseudomonas sp. DWP3-1-2]|uniref:type IV pilus modification PilV family protein n=1 Tax=Pseudomonas sp. DWP3-1-2 TaxID=2804645 RepID=UPI003CED5ED4